MRQTEKDRAGIPGNEEIESWPCCVLKYGILGDEGELMKNVHIKPLQAKHLREASFDRRVRGSSDKDPFGYVYAVVSQVGWIQKANGDFRRVTFKDLDELRAADVNRLAEFVTDDIRDKEEDAENFSEEKEEEVMD